MMNARDYRPIVLANEAVFRNILRDMRGDEKRRPRSKYIPQDLETEAAINVLFEKYSTGNRYGRFSITDFSMPSKDSAIIVFADVACMSGGGGKLEYSVKPDNSLEFKRTLEQFIS
jgi:hypothetical protein